MKPHFLYVGAARSGSTYLYEVLRRHPQIFVPLARDLNFFSRDRNFKRGLKWYLKYFKPAKGEVVAGEIDHDYYLSVQSLKRIQSLFPHIKLICCLREPIEKTYSQYNFWHPCKISESSSFLDYARSDEAISQADYYNLLKPMFEIFSRDQILILFYDELKESPLRFVEKIFDFLGVSPDFYHSIMEKKINPMRIPRNSCFIKYAYRAYCNLKNMGLQNTTGWIKYHPFINKVFFKRSSRLLPLDTSTIKELTPIYHQNLDELQKLIKRDLPSNWRL